MEFNIVKGVLRSVNSPPRTTLGEQCLIPYPVTIPEGVHTIGAEVFIGYDFTDIAFPSSLKVIGEASFAACTMGDLRLPEGLVRISTRAFYQCTLKSLELPSTLEQIDPYAFGYCYGFKHLDIPRSVQMIFGYAFCGTDLESISFHPVISTLVGFAPYSAVNAFANNTLKYIRIGDKSYPAYSHEDGSHYADGSTLRIVSVGTPEVNKVGDTSRVLESVMEAPIEELLGYEIQQSLESRYKSFIGRVIKARLGGLL